MKFKRTTQPSPANLNPILHCPVCWHKRTHNRKIENGHEIYECLYCHNIQTYKIKETVEAA